MQQISWRVVVFGLAAVFLGLALMSSAADVKPKRAPALPSKHWLNTPGDQPLRLEALRGKVVLVEFWTYG